MGFLPQAINWYPMVMVFVRGSVLFDCYGTGWMTGSKFKKRSERQPAFLTGSEGGMHEDWPLSLRLLSLRLSSGFSTGPEVEDRGLSIRAEITCWLKSSWVEI